MALNRVKLGRAVTFMKYFARVVSLIFLAKTVIWNKITFPASNLLDLAELVVNEPLKSIYKKNYQYFFFYSIYHCLNSIRNKFDLMKTMLTRDIDILMITETKLDDSFPVSQFEIDGFSTPFRLDRNKNGGGILLYIRSYIVASKLKSYIFPNDIEASILY